jgi:hypothetical protein
MRDLIPFVFFVVFVREEEAGSRLKAGMTKEEGPG